MSPIRPGLPDYLAPGLSILFVGINPGLRSSEVGHHYAGHSNRFWKLLFDAGLVPDRMTCQDDWRLLDYGYGLTNLIANAIKFSPENGEILVQVERSDKAIRLRVSDEGTGIPEDELSQVFDKFYQSAGNRNQSGGTGLGLAICRQIIDLHRGRIWAENNPSNGASILFEIPLDKTH